MGEMISTLPIARATTFDEYVYDIDANWKTTFDNFQENYHVRFVHVRVAGNPPMSGENPFGYPGHYQVFGPHRMYTNCGGSPHEDRPKPVLNYLFGKLGAQLAAEGLLDNPHVGDYLIFFPNFICHASPAMHFTHAVLPLSANKTRGVFRFYWQGDDSSASQRLAREFSMAFGREIHAEDGDVLRSAQRGLDSGATEHINLQQQEVMCRHLFEQVNAQVQGWLAKSGRAGAMS
jgi:phenylpropionate dioxygenase-like ring-hydroxylating dioxygenase large terminal subunit